MDSSEEAAHLRKLYQHEKERCLRWQMMADRLAERLERRYHHGWPGDGGSRLCPEGECGDCDALRAWQLLTKEEDERDDPAG